MRSEHKISCTLIVPTKPNWQLLNPIVFEKKKITGKIMFRKCAQDANSFQMV